MLNIVVRRHKLNSQQTLAYCCFAMLMDLGFTELIDRVTAVAFLGKLCILFFVFVVIFSLCLHKQASQLNYYLDHSTNILRVPQAGLENKYFSVMKHSKVSPLGVWLYLRLTESHDASVQQLFIGRWQVDERSFRALHRHVNWYLL